MSETKNVETKVEKVEVNLDEIFNGAPGAESVTLPEEESKKPNVFSRKKDVDMSFIDKPAAEETKKEEEKPEATEEKSEVVEEKKEEKKETVTPDQIDEILGDNQQEEEVTAETETKKRGRKPISGVSDVFKKLIDEEKLLAFDDGKELEDYTAKDWQELIQANLEEKANAARRETPKQFFESLPQELQIAARYVADGGTDLKGIFKALSVVEETRDLNVKEVKDQKHIIREYLSATGYGTQE